MAKLTLNGTVIEAPDGAPLLEVIKQQGVFISNLCYIDGLPPYAGCRTCLIEVEGARGLQLACTTSVSDNMVVNTQKEEVTDARRQVMSIIMANHSDRCLTCHRTIHCRPGDICLRDDIVTHRCLTCSKNYRCELQTTTEVLEMAKFEPWFGEKRTYYEMEELPPADRANPYVEFDPQMCIICTRCVRACDELRHTDAITLGGRGFATEIMFGSGGAIHESSCDFCGTCIDVCPVAALMEHPNKWIAHTNTWVETTCSYCSVGCSLKMGVRNGKAVIVKPDTIANPVSKDQLCVRGRFGYDALKNRDRIQRPTMLRGLVQQPLPWDQAIHEVSSRLLQIRKEFGPESIAVLGSPMSTTEENYLLSKIARLALGTNNVDHSLGPIADAVGGALRDAFGSEVLVADMLDLAQSDVIVAVGNDIEQSHPVAALRLKDAVERKGARMITVSSYRGELDDFAAVALSPDPLSVTSAVAALAERLLAEPSMAARLTELGGSPATGAGDSGVDAGKLDSAAAVLAEAAASGDLKVSIVYAPGHLGPEAAAATTRALANLALLLRGGEASAALHVLTPEVNVTGMRDAGLAPTLLPGYRRVDSEPDRKALAELWHEEAPATPGLSFNEMLDAARAGRLKAAVIVRDNPLMLAPNRAAVEEALKALDFLVVIDEVMTDTAKLAHVVLPEVSMFGRDGTFTTSDRRIVRQRPAIASQGEARQAWQILTALGADLIEKAAIADVSFNYAAAADVMEEMALLVPLYAGAPYDDLISGTRQHFPEGAASAGRLQPLPAVPAASSSGALRLVTSRSQFTSYEAAAINSPEADKLHREEFVQINPADAARLGIEDGAAVQLATDRGELAIPAHLDERVRPGTVFVPLYYSAGAVLALLGREGEAAMAPEVRVRATAAV